MQFRHLELSNEYEIKIGFLTRSGKRDTIIVSARDRSEFEKIRRELCARDARLPMDRKAGLRFVETLIGATPKDAVKVVSKPGFRDGAKGFVMPARMYGTAKGRFVWDANFGDPKFGEIRGDLAQYREGVLKPALASPFMSFAILIALAAPLCSYTEQKDGRGKLLSEGAIFHWAGESSSGKTTLARITQSVFGSPDIVTDYEATPRGVAEAAYARNDLVASLDDTENAGLADRELLKYMKFSAQRLASGRSKVIARSAGGSFPPLTWFTLGVSTGPETLAKIAQRIGSKRGGERPRFFDLAVPSSAQGGIFAVTPIGTYEAIEDSAAATAKVESSITKNHGVLFDPWIPFLLSKDQSARVRSLVHQFVRMTADGENGMEIRIARKFGVMYAAGVIAIEARLLPWPSDWVRDVVRYCFNLARNARDPNESAVEVGLKAIARALKFRERFPRHGAEERKTPSITDATLGLCISRNGKSNWFIFPDRLGLIGIKDSKTRQLIMEKMRALGLIEASKNATSSVQLRVKTAKQKDLKLRAWRLRRDRTLEWAAQREARMEPAT